MGRGRGGDRRGGAGTGGGGAQAAERRGHSDTAFGSEPGGHSTVPAGQACPLLCL